MGVGTNDEGVEPWEFSTPSVHSESGQRIPFDERSTVEIQMELQRLETNDRRERSLWWAVLLPLVVFLVVIGDSALLASLGVLAAGLAAAAIGVLRVRRRQLREGLEDELAARRREELEEATDPAFRLAALRDELDRREGRRDQSFAIVLGSIVAVALVIGGLVIGPPLVSAAGVFFGLLAGSTLLEERRHRREEASLRDAVREIERPPDLPPSV